MHVTRRGVVVYLSDGWSDRTWQVEIARGGYASDTYRVKAPDETTALEMVAGYKAGKGEPGPFLTYGEMLEATDGDVDLENDYVYVDPGYYIPVTDFSIRPYDRDGGGRSASKRRASDPFGFLKAVMPRNPPMGYVAVVRTSNGDVRVTNEYTREVLTKMVIPDALESDPGSELMDVIPASEKESYLRGRFRSGSDSTRSKAKSGTKGVRR